jgi:hypothetical protein
VSSKRWGNVGYQALILGAALFSLLIGINAMGYRDSAARWAIVALWVVAVALALTLRSRADRRKGPPGPPS